MCRHWIDLDHNGVYCEETGKIVGGPGNGPLIIGQVGTRLALRLLWQSVRGWKPPKDGSRAVGYATSSGQIAVDPMHAGPR